MTNTAGRKDDGGKLDITLFFDDLPHAIEGVTEVLQWAITHKKPTPYERGSWQGVPDFQRRYRAAQLRHQLAQAKARKLGQSDYGTDAETGLLELQHIATDAMFQLEMAMRDLAAEKTGRLDDKVAESKPYDDSSWGGNIGVGLNGLGS